MLNEVSLREVELSPGDIGNLKDVRVLVVDDEEILAWSIETEIKKLGAQVKRAGTAITAREAFDSFVPDVVICDLKLPDGSGLDLLKEWKAKIPTVPVILITAHGAMESAVSAVRLSAFDYLRKPFDMKDLVAAVGRASEISQLRQKVKSLEGAVKGRDPVNILGQSQKVRDLRRKLERVAQSGTDTVLVYGETGSGKELAARSIHEWSRHNEQPYIEINCASIPENLLESELFGYEKGAFTDARSRKLGLFEMAKDGTIFLDEIGEMPLNLQSKLLRALEYRRFRRLGGVKDIEFNATIVAATNRDLIHEVEKKNFRADLYYRLNVVPIQVPSLREHKEDISVLTDFFVEKIAKQLKMKVPKVQKATYEILKSHTWPGNVRELKNTLQRALVLEAPTELQPQHIQLERPIDFSRMSSSDGTPSQGGAPDSAEAGHSQGSFVLPSSGVNLDEVEKDFLVQALERTHYNQSKAASLLGVTRHVLRYRLEKHGLSAKLKSQH